MMMNLIKNPNKISYQISAFVCVRVRMAEIIGSFNFFVNHQEYRIQLLATKSLA